MSRELDGGDQTRTAELLKIGSATLYRRLKKYSLIASAPGRGCVRAPERR